MKALLFPIYFLLIFQTCFSQNFVQFERLAAKNFSDLEIHTRTSGSINSFAIPLGLVNACFSDNNTNRVNYIGKQQIALSSIVKPRHGNNSLILNSEKAKMFTFRYLNDENSPKIKNSFVPKAALTASSLLFTAIPKSSSLPQNEMMDKIHKRTYISGALFIPTIATGYLMSNAEGRPNTLLLTTHKLVAVSNLVLLDITAIQKNKTMKLSVAEKITAITMNVCFVGTIATGGMLSIDKEMPNAVHTAHNITPWLTVLSSGVLLYLLNAMH